MTRRQHVDALLRETNDFLANLQTVLHTATIDQQIAIEQATQTIYGPNEGNHYNRLTSQVDNLHNRIHDHLEN
ncbi:MAG: hypothetical protein EPN48_14940 [Microbacteriaceae bacterium]|nr:MAG: hypothetical protein EPN48_14940 [Microbacteriaceae bacterium]